MLEAATLWQSALRHNNDDALDVAIDKLTSAVEGLHRDMGWRGK